MSPEPSHTSTGSESLLDPESREEIVKKHLPMVDELVRVMKGRFGPAVDSDELKSLAMEAFATALTRFDPTREISFRTFARPRIQGAMYDGMTKSSGFPRRLRRKIALYRRSEELLQYRANDPKPTDRLEAVDRLRKTLKGLAVAHMTTYAVSEDDDREPASVPPDAEQKLERKRCRLQLMASINSLPKSQSEVILAYFFDELTMRQIAQKTGKHPSWVSRLVSAALENLHSRLDRSDIAVEAFEDRTDGESGF